MRRLYLTAGFLVVLAAAFAAAAWVVAARATVPAAAATYSWVPLAIYLFLFNLAQQILKEATDLLGHPALSAIMVGKVSKRVNEIRLSTYGLHLYFGLALIGGVVISYLATQATLPPAFAVSAVTGSTIMSLGCWGWLYAKQQEIYRFRLRLEQQKRDDDRRDKQAKDLADGNKDADRDGPPAAFRLAIQPGV